MRGAAISEWYSKETMNVPRVRRLVIYAAAALLPAACWGRQTAIPPGRASTPRPVPSRAMRAPFDLNAPPGAGARAVEFRAAAAMAVQDQREVHDQWPLIVHDSADLGFNLDEGQWEYQQIVCPVFSPAKIVLLFSREAGSSRSMFSAVVGRSGGPDVRILPILRHGYSPFKSASVSPLTIATFNGIRAHASGGKEPDWLTSGLCYAALAGVRVRLAGMPAAPAGPAPLLEVTRYGAVVHFADLEPGQRPMEWVLSFDQAGRLLKVSVSSLRGLKFSPIRPR